MAIACSLLQTAFAAEIPQERVEILAGGQCAVRGTKLQCVGVAKYLLEELKLDRGYLVRVGAGPAVKITYPQLQALFESLKAAGFATYTAQRKP